MFLSLTSSLLFFIRRLVLYPIGLLALNNVTVSAEGFEPSLEESKSSVLPLHHTDSVTVTIYSIIYLLCFLKTQET